MNHFKDLTPIIVLFVLFVLLSALAMIILVRNQEQKLSKEKDFLQVFMENRKNMLQESHVPFSIGIYGVLIILCISGACLAGYLLSSQVVPAVLFGCIGGCIPDLLISLSVSSRKRKFNQQYAKALEQLSSSLKAGLSIPLAVKDVVDCPFIDEDMRKRFSYVSSDLQMGRTVQEAFNSFAETAHNRYASDVALSIDIQNEVGGHEAEVIRDIADGIHERLMLEKEIRSVFTDTTITMSVIQVLIPVCMIFMLAIMPSYQEAYLGGGINTVVFIIIAALELTGAVMESSMLRRAMKGH